MSSGRPPQLKRASVIQLLQKNYNFAEVVDSSLKQLPSYYDVNFYFQGTLALGENGTCRSQGEYMFKIMNCVRTSSEMAIALSALWCHLQEKGLKYSGPILNRQGEMVTLLTSFFFFFFFFFIEILHKARTQK